VNHCALGNTTALPLLIAALMAMWSAPTTLHAQDAPAAAAPSCSSDAAKGVLDQMFRKKDKDFIDTYGSKKDEDQLVADTVLEFAAIRTQDRDAATGAVTCAATFTSTIPPIPNSQAFPGGFKKSGDVQYKVEKTDDGQIYVTILQADRPY
jgi:hypothetical protein